MPVVNPSQIFPNYTSDGTSITIPLTDLEGLTAAEADATTGNAMEVVRAIVEKTHMQLTSFATTARPTRASIIKDAPAIAVGAGIAPGTLSQGYRLNFNLTPTGLEPTPE